ncbi:GGDEF domain-containing protein [Streptomyces sp. SID3343]|uniref:GGDEF domain-containing protein n=1 Tax=Streptomyces sp. SID3343 TaxID=2690260 RepID=UPI00136FE158|nr:GGDEF domain-containing protein [Streptomyces sp. SID3343]MYW04502.1 diguanylate cyclase [Streptomyces sp. SID3343]
MPFADATLSASVAGVPLIGWATHTWWLARRLAAARRDPLTHLHTRDGWTARAHRIVTHPDAYVLLLDLDGFKHINDTRGHLAGDEVLAQTAHRLASWCGPHGVAGRLGGDEFVAAVRLSGHESAPGLDRLRDRLRAPVVWDGHVIPVGVSIGSARVADLPLRTLGNALAHADIAMYAAKGTRGRR